MLFLPCTHLFLDVLLFEVGEVSKQGASKGFAFAFLVFAENLKSSVHKKQEIEVGLSHSFSEIPYICLHCSFCMQYNKGKLLFYACSYTST